MVLGVDWLVKQPFVDLMFDDHIGAVGYSTRYIGKIKERLENNVVYSAIHR